MRSMACRTVDVVGTQATCAFGVRKKATFVAIHRQHTWKGISDERRLCFRDTTDPTMPSRSLPNRLAPLVATAALAACVSAERPPVDPVSPPAPAADRPSPKLPPLPEEYEDCPRVRSTGSGPLGARDRAEARASAWMWPAPCGAVSGWAGISIVKSVEAVAFSRDGRRLLACGVSPDDACVVEDLARGVIVERVAQAFPDGLDGTPVTETAPVKALLQRLGAPAPQGPLPFPGDLRASWRVAPGGHALEITLVALATGDERVVARFPGPSGASGQPIVLEGASVAPGGAHFEAHVFTGMGGTGYQIAVVNVYAEAAALFREAARRGGDAGRLAEKAREAEAGGRASAATFVLGGPSKTSLR